MNTTFHVKTSFILKVVCLAIEAVLAIPIFGGSLIFTFLWLPLVFMFFLHLGTLVISAKEDEPIYPSIIGMVASFLGAIPFLGWLLHVVTAVVLLFSVMASYKKEINTAETAQQAFQKTSSPSNRFDDDESVVFDHPSPPSEPIVAEEHSSSLRQEQIADAVVLQESEDSPARNDKSES